jgi:hypothetical protein
MILENIDSIFAEEPREKAKNSFWASETELNVFDTYHRWIGTEPTNPPDAKTKVIFSAGKMIEEALVQRMVELGYCEDFGEDQKRIEMEREGVPISGYIDAVLADGTPVEIKTCYGDYQEKEIAAGKPRTSYLKQLAIYMDFLDKDRGVLFYMNRGLGTMHEFVLTRENGMFVCNKVDPVEKTSEETGVSFDINDVYKRWARLYKNNVLPKVEPKSEYRYKYEINEENFGELSKYMLTKILNGNKVLGDWQVIYSSYKDLILEREGTGLGYTPEELDIIKTFKK